MAAAAASAAAPKPKEREKARGPITKPFKPAVPFARGQVYDLGAGLGPGEVPKDLSDHRTPKKEEKLYACLHHACHEMFRKWSVAVSHMKTCANGDGKRGAIDQCYLKAHAIVDARRRLAAGDDGVAEEGAIPVLAAPSSAAPPEPAAVEAPPPPRELFRRGSTYDLGDGLRGKVPADLPDIRECAKADQAYACGHDGCSEVFRKWSDVQEHMRLCEVDGDAMVTSRQQCFMKAYALYDAQGTVHRWTEHEWDAADDDPCPIGHPAQRGSLWGGQAWDQLGWPPLAVGSAPASRGHYDPRRWTETAPETRASNSWLNISHVPKHQSAQFLGQESLWGGGWGGIGSQRESLSNPHRGSLWGWPTDESESTAWSAHTGEPNTAWNTARRSSNGSNRTPQHGRGHAQDSQPSSHPPPQ